jgi:O-antigen ligase
VIFVVPAITGLLASMAFLSLGVLRTGVVVVLVLACWVGLLENLRTGKPSRQGRTAMRIVMMLWVFYAALLFLALFVNSPSLKEDVLVYLPGQALFLYFITARKVAERTITVGMVVVGSIQAALGVLQLTDTRVFDSIFARFLGEVSASNYHFIIGRVPGIWLDSVRFGVFLATCLPFAALWARKKPTLLRVALLGFIAVVLMLTFTRVAVMSMIVTGILTLWDSRQKILTRVLPILLVVALALIVLQSLPIGKDLERLYSPASYTSEYASNAESYNRGAVLDALLPLVLKQPMFGIGVSYREFLSAGFTSAHNSMLESALLFGIPDSALLAVIVLVLMLALWRVLRKPNSGFALAALLSALAVAIGGTTHGVGFDGPLNMMFWGMAGLGIRQAIEVLWPTVEDVSA